MFGEQRTRTLLGPADPARAATVGPPRLPARDLITRAEAGVAPLASHYLARPSRRLVLAGAAAAVAAGGAAVVYANAVSTVDNPNAGPPSAPAGGTVLVPIAYQYNADAQPAGDQLRQLADRLADAPFDHHTGRYTYHHVKIWGDPIMQSGPYILGYVHEEQVWRAPDGTGRQSSRSLEPQYPDQQSRDFWQRALKNGLPSGKAGPINVTPAPSTYPLPPLELPPLPTDRPQLARLFRVQDVAGGDLKQVVKVYQWYAVPRATRSQILRVLADVAGFLWRGEVTDRAGREGLAITFDDRPHDQQSLLVFDPKTGELLAMELVTSRRLSTYILFLGTDLTDELG